MRNHFIPGIVILGILWASAVQASDVIEVPVQVLSQNYLDVMERVENADELPASAKLTLVNAALAKSNTPYERFNLIFWGASFQHAALDQYENCLEILSAGQAEGFFYPLMTGERQWPPYLEHLADLEGFDSFMALNENLKQAAAKHAKFEYSVQLPEGYTPEKSYPLILVMQGGFGSHIELSHIWQSPGIKSDYVIAWLQGVTYRGSFLRSYGEDSLDHIVEAFDNISEKYSVNTSQIVLAGQSFGVQSVFDLALDELVPASGLFLVVPSVPRLPDQERLIRAAGRDVKVVLMAGADDSRIERQKAMAADLKTAGLEVLLRVYPGVGHEVPRELTEDFDTALEFLKPAS